MDERALGTKVSKRRGATYPTNRLVILQPSYLPWIGFFGQMARADQFVFLDDVQHTRRDWRSRNKIRTKEGWLWLTVPVQQKNLYKQLLKETRVDNSINWNKKHSEAIRLNYAKAPFFEKYYPCLESVYKKRWEFLLDLCYETTDYLKDFLNITTPTSKSSDLSAEGAKTDLLLDLCQKMNATHYLTGNLASDYLSQDSFYKEGIQLEFQNYNHPMYSQ